MQSMIFFYFNRLMNLRPFWRWWIALVVFSVWAAGVAGILLVVLAASGVPVSSIFWGAVSAGIPAGIFAATNLNLN